MAEGHLHSEFQDGASASGATECKMLLTEKNLSGSLDEEMDFDSQRLSSIGSGNSMKSDKSMDIGDDFKACSERTSEHTTEEGHVLCDVCPKRASKSCLTCMASFCGDHVKVHYTAPALQRHKLVEATEDLEQRLCPQHKKELELYCNTDQTTLCMLCLAKGHIGHDITDLGEHQEMQRKELETEKNAAIPSPGPIEFISVNPDSVCLRWERPEGLAGPHTFSVSWINEGRQEHLEVNDTKLNVQELHAGEKYTFTVATLRDDSRQSVCVSATVQTVIPPPEGLAVDVDLISVSVRWRKPTGVDQASYLLTLCSDGEALQTLSIKSLQHCFTGLTLEKEYSIAVSTALKGRQSKPISKSIRTSIPVPENLTVVSLTPTSADLSWSLHQGMEQIPHSFLISCHSEGTEPQTISTESCRTTLTDLQPDTQYTISVSCELRDGGNSQVTSTIIQTDSFKPEGLSVTALNEACYAKAEWSADLSWSPPKWHDQSSHSFKITYQSGTGPNTITRTTTTNSCTKTLTGLQSDTEYTVNVSSVLQDGKERKPASVTFHTSERRILLLGKSGEGKSSTGNTILGETVFTANGCQDSVTAQCETRSRIINGRKYTVTDTPGFFDTVRSEEKLVPEIAKCIFDSAPGPHAFIIVMRVGRFTTQEQEVLQKIKEIFAEDTFKHALVVFTHGRDLDNQTVEQFVEKSGYSGKTALRNFVDACHGHCHVIDNEHWKQTEGESSNGTQLQKLFDTIEGIVQENGCYSNDFSLLIVKAIQQEMEKMREQERGLTDRVISERAKTRVEKRVLLNKCAATLAAWLYGAFGLQKCSGCVDRAAATTSSPNEAIKEYRRLLNILKE